MIKTSDRRTPYIRSITGWVLEPLIRCDEAWPSLLRRAMVASPLRRQGIFTALSQLNVNHPEDLATKLRPLVGDDSNDLDHPLAIIAKALATARVRDLLRALYGSVEGLIGVLGRLGYDPLSADDYRTLVEIHIDPRHRARALLLREIPEVSGRAIKVLVALDVPYLLPILIRRLGSVQEVEDFGYSLELIKRLVPEARDVDLIASLEHLQSSTHIRDWVTRWLHRATIFLNDPPIKDDDEFVVLNSASAIRDAARRYENCLKRDRLVHCALGRECYVEHVPTQILVELRVLNRGAVFEGLHRARNSFVDAEAARTVISGLRNRGVLIPAQLVQAPTYGRVARFARIYDLARSEFDLIETVNRIELRVSNVT